MNENTAAPAKIVANSSLIDDFLMIMHAPVSDQLAGMFVVVENPSADPSSSSELLTVNASGDLVHFYPDSTSHSGWTVETVDVVIPSGASGSPIAGLQAAYDPSGALIVLVSYMTPWGAIFVSFMLRTASGWSSPDFPLDPSDGSYAAQLSTYISGEGTFFCGAGQYQGNTVAFILAYSASDNQLNLIYTSGTTEIAYLDSMFIVNSSGPGNVDLFVWAGRVVTLYLQNGTLNTNGYTPTSDAPPRNIVQEKAEVHDLPGTLGSDAVVMRATETPNVVYLLTYLSTTGFRLKTLTGATDEPTGASVVAVGADSEGNNVIYAIEPGTNQLWLLSQKSGSTTLEFNNWINLGRTTSMIGCPRNMPAGPEFFCVDINEDVYHVSRTLGDNPVWSTRQVAAPTPRSGTPLHTSVYAIELDVTDSDGNPLSNTLIDITVNQTVTLLWNGVSYPIADGQTVEIQTCNAGHARVDYQPTGMTQPVITFTVNNGSSGNQSWGKGSSWCQGDVTQGQSTTYAATTQVATTLKNATGNTLTLEGIFNKGGPVTSADCAASAINQAGKWMAANSTDSDAAGMIDASKLTGDAWELDLTNKSGGPAFRFLTAADLSKQKEAADDSDWPKWLNKILGDVVEYLKHDVKKLEALTSTTENDVLTIGIQIDGALQNFVVNTIQEAGAALECLISAIKVAADTVYVALQEVLTWLKNLFEWDDILNTQRFFVSVINSYFTGLKDSIGDLQTYMSNSFSGMQTQVQSFFETTLSNPNLGLGTSFNAFIGGSTGTLQDNSGQLAVRQNSSQCNYLMNIINSAGNAITLPSGGGSCQTFTDALQAIDATTFNSNTANIFGSDVDAQDLFGTDIATFLAALEDICIFVLDAAEAMLNALIDILADSITQFQEMLNSEVDIPGLTWLWKNVITDNEDLTLLDMVALVIAVPGTILYKVLYATTDAPFSSGETLTDLPWPTLSDIGSGAGASDSNSAPANPTQFLLLQKISAVLSIWQGPFVVVTDFYPMSADEDEVPNAGLFICNGVTYVTDLMCQVADLPSNMVNAVKPKTGTDNSLNLNWWFGNLSLAANSATMAALKGTLLKRVDKIGPIGETFCGVLNECTAVIAMANVIDDAGDKYALEAMDLLLDPLISASAFLLLKSNIPDAKLLRGGLDLLLGAAETFVTFELVFGGGQE